VSNLSDLLPAGASGKTIEAVATANITSKAPVILNSTGTVSPIVETSDAAGSPVVYEAANVRYNAATFDSASNKVFIAYQDRGNSFYGTGVVGTVSGTSTSYGTPVVFESGDTRYISSTFDSNSNKVVIAYQDYPNTNKGTAIVGTVSGTSISFGTAVVFAVQAQNTFCSFDSASNKVVISYTDANNSDYGTSIVGTVSGTAISFGTAAVFQAAASVYISSAFDSNLNKVVIAYQNNPSTSYGTAIVGTVSGTSISFGSSAIFESAGTTYIGATFDSSNNKVVIGYKDEDNSGYGTAVVGTVSGTAISFGTPVVFEAAASNDKSLAFDSTLNKVVIAYTSNATNGTAIVGTVSGTAISFGSPVVFETDGTEWISSTFDSNSNKVVIAYQDNGNSNYGTGVVFSVGGSNLTAANFVGIADAAISSSATGTIVVQGGTVTGANATLPQTMSFGSATVFEPAESGDISSTFDSNSNKVVVAYRVDGAGWYGTAAVGTVSGNSISYGTPVVFESANTESCAATFDSSSNKIVIAYKDAGNSKYGTAIVGTVSGTSISFGTAALFESVRSDHIVATFDSDSNKVVIAYLDTGGSNTGEAIVGTVSGTSISFGTAAQFKASVIEANSITFDSNANKVVVAFRDEGNSSYGTAVVGTVSGTSISFGTAVVYETATAASTSCTFDSDSNKVVVAFRDNGNSSYGTSIVGTVSGTAISFGAAAVFESGGVDDIGSTFDPTNNKVVLAYRNGSNSDHGTSVIGTVSGTSIAFGTAVVYEAAGSRFNSVIFDSNSNKVVVCYGDSGNSTYGTSIVGAFGNDFATGSKYYVTPAGSYSTSAGSPSVNAGLAISTTALLLNGDT